MYAFSCASSSSRFWASAIADCGTAASESDGSQSCTDRIKLMNCKDTKSRVGYRVSRRMIKGQKGDVRD